jgi:IclR family pca regulon transcriptional regulator
MRSLARGIAVLRAFEGQSALSVADAARETGLSRAAAGRCLYTLELLGLISEETGSFRPTPGLLPLACAYLAASPLASAGQAMANVLRDRLGESVSLGAIDPAERSRIVYIARAERNRIIATPLVVGSTLPSHCTSMGRVLLAALPSREREDWLRNAALHARTHRTITDRVRLAEVLDGVAAQGWALVEEELETGLTALAVPVRDRGGTVVAALNVATFAASTGTGNLVARVLPELRAAARELERAS